MAHRSLMYSSKMYLGAFILLASLTEQSEIIHFNVKIWLRYSLLVIVKIISALYQPAKSLAHFVSAPLRLSMVKLVHCQISSWIHVLLVC